jgi:D-lactate dehydrogenase
VTSHQGFLTHEALSEIARITCENFSRGNHGGPFLEGTELTT